MQGTSESERMEFSICDFWYEKGCRGINSRHLYMPDNEFHTFMERCISQLADVLTGKQIKLVLVEEQEKGDAMVKCQRQSVTILTPSSTDGSGSGSDSSRQCLEKNVMSKQYHTASDDM